MRISHIDIKLTDSSNCVMKMDELPQVIQLSLKDAIFSWLLLKNSEQNVKPTKPEVSYSKEILLQQKPVAEKRAISSDVADKILASPQVKKDAKTGLSLPAGSSRLVLHRETVRFFVANNNNWVSKVELARRMSNNRMIGLAKSTIQTYMCDMVKVGLLQDIEGAYGNSKQVRVSPALINEMKK